MDRTINEAFKFNKENELTPVLGLIASELNGDKKDDGSPPKQAPSSVQNNHHPALLAALADELSVAQEEIHDFEL